MREDYLILYRNMFRSGEQFSAQNPFILHETKTNEDHIMKK